MMYRHVARAKKPNAKIGFRKRFSRVRVIPSRKLVYFLVAFCLIATLILLPGVRFSGGRGKRGIGERVEEIVEEGVKIAIGEQNLQGQDDIEGSTGISAVVLFHNEYDTFQHTLETWEKYGLYQCVTEVVVFLNGVKSEDVFRQRIKQVNSGVWKNIIKVVPSEENLKLGLAITKMVELAEQDIILLLEKDWALIEDEQTTRTMLNEAKGLLEQKKVDIVRFRHRHRPGAPLHARIMHEGREEQMLQQQKNLYCYLHHWVQDLGGKYPQFFTKCLNETTATDEVMWCAKSKYCQWTNNPGMFRKQWFIEELGNKFRQMVEKTIEKDPSNAMLDFEFYTNWQNDVWNDRGFVVALPKGLFEHQEIGEQNLMNTVWYAWNRLHTDTEEKRRALLATEVKECTEGKKTLTSGPTWKEKFPIDFVRLYHYDKAMMRTEEDAVSELLQLANKYKRMFEEGDGNWRSGITDLTNLWYKTILYSWPLEPEAQDITIVTSLHKGEGELSESDLETAYRHMNTMADYGIMVFCSQETKERADTFMKGKDEFATISANIKYVMQPLPEAIESALGKDSIDKIEKLYSYKPWQSAAKERGGRIPSLTELKLSMAKPYLLNSAIDNKEGSHFLWMDVLSPCFTHLREKNSALTLGTDSILRSKMLLSAFVTGVRGRNRGEVEAGLGASGFSVDKLMEEMRVSENSLSSGLVLPDLKIMGGSRLAITLMTGYYDVVLRDMLKQNELGTGREAMSIAYKNVDYNFEFFDSRDGCRTGDRCEAPPLDMEYAMDESKGCALFRWASGCVQTNG